MKNILTKPKHCWMCDGTYPRTTEYFNKNHASYGGGFDNTCKKCKKKLNSSYRIKKGYSAHPRINRNARNMQYIWSAKEGGCCVLCGEQRTEILLFHHVEPKEKSFSLSRPRHKLLEEIKAEIAKCDLMCANCHLSLHYWERHK